MARFVLFITAITIAFAATETVSASDAYIQPVVLQSDAFKHYIDSFNANDQELYPGYITNGAAWNFLRNNIPLFDCPDKDIEQIYYFRWWTYRKHIKRTPDGFIITEFLPDVPWAGKDNAISCAAGHHIYEGRWLADPKYLDDYSIFWFRKGGDPRRYSTWLADALWARYLVNANSKIVTELLPDLAKNFEAWEKSHLGTNGLFFQTDDRDGMELSIGGRGYRRANGDYAWAGGDAYRPTINSYMYGDALATANIAALADQAGLAEQYRKRAASLKDAVQERLWDKTEGFFKILPRGHTRLVDVRELHGYTPWYFCLPDATKSIAWKQLIDPRGFFALFGPTMAEQRDPAFTIAYGGHECQWNGPSWPYATSVTLTAMANFLNDYRQNVVNRRDYFDLLKRYAKSQHLKLDDGREVPWIDENLDPYTGVWIARTVLKQGRTEILERGKDYKVLRCFRWNRN